MLLESQPYVAILRATTKPSAHFQQKPRRSFMGLSLHLLYHKYFDSSIIPYWQW